jgi:mannitol-specific phosphotransferase system IIBC component
VNPVAKYFLARLGLFAAIAAPLTFVMNALLALAIGLLGSLVLSVVLLKGMRNEMITHIDARAKQRREEKERLRAELKGEA